MIPKVSVIIPVYNAEPYLRECLDSVISQTLHEIEIICINDGSTDGSLAILEEYVAKDSRLKILSQENKGAGTARNEGIKIAEGEYLSFLDADDIFKKTLLEKTYRKAKKSNADIVAFNFCRFDNQSRKITKVHWKFKKKYFPLKYPFSYKDVPQSIFKVLRNEAWNKIFKRELIISNDIKFHEIKSSNDLFFTWCAVFNAEKIDIEDKRLVYLRRGHNTNIQSNNDSNILDFYYAFWHLREYLKSVNKYENIMQQFGNYFLANVMYNLFSLKEVGQFNFLYDRLKELILSDFVYDENDNDYYSVLKDKSEILDKSCLQFLFDKNGDLRKELDAIYFSFFYQVYNKINQKIS